VLVELARQNVRPDLILFANTGNEKQETYDYLPVINDWLERKEFPRVTVVRNVVQDFKHWPPYYSLGENCLTNGTLPSLAFGFKSCSQKWKVTPQNSSMTAGCLRGSAGPRQQGQEDHRLRQHAEGPEAVRRRSSTTIPSTTTGTRS
jgi:hypothetical protein